MAAAVKELTVRTAKPTAGLAIAPSDESRAVDAATWATLTRLAHRTLVPASEASRAGAGGSDAD